MGKKILNIILVVLLSAMLSGCVDVFGNYNHLTNTTYTVTFDLQGGSGLFSTTESVKAGTRFPTEGNFDASTIEKDGYIFNGFYSLVNGLGTRYDYIPSVTNNITLYADWNLETEEPNLAEGEVSVTFVSGITPELSVIIVEQGSRAPESGTFNIPEKEGYLFLGWYDNSLFGGKNIDYIESTTESTTLYAKWLQVASGESDIEIETTYTIFFDANSGFGTMGSQSFAEGEEVKLLKNTYLPPYADIYFAGWSLISGGDITYANEQIITLTSDTTLYAVWVAQKIYSIAFNANGGIGSMNSYQLAYGRKFLVPSSIFSPPYGGVFCPGWATSQSGNILYKPGEIIQITESITLYAVWKASIFLSFNANGGSGIMDKQGFYANESKAIKANAFTAPVTTKKFAGWATSASGTVVCEDMGIYSIPYNTTLYAIWEDRTYYNIKFNGCGGNGSMENQQIEENVAQAINKNTFFPPYRDVIFKGWSLTNGGEVNYVDQQSIILTRNLELYATWDVLQTFTVTFYPNGGSGDVYTKQLVQNCLVKIPTVEFLPPYSGVGFAGWATSPEGEIVYTDKQITKFTSNTNLYAKWSVYFKIYFDTMGGTSVNTIAGLEGTRVPYEGVFADSIKAEAIFGGWFTEPNGQGTQYSYIEKIREELTLYAHWIYPYSIGEVMTVYLDLMYDALFLTETAIHGSRIPETGSFPIPTREGYEFLGWYTGRDGFGDKVDYLNEITKNTTLYAHWKYVADKIPVTVTLNTQGGSNLENIVVTYNERAPLAGNLPSPYKTGYIFSGWFTELNGLGTEYKYISNLSNNITLYAYWRLDVANKYVVNFNSMGGTAVDNIYTLSGKSAPSIGNFEIPKRTGYVFFGWYDNVQGDGTKYEYISSVNSNIVLYAYWQINVYSVTFDSEGGSSKPMLVGNHNTRLPVTGYFDKSIKSGYVFMGWFTGDNGTGVNIKYIKSLTKDVKLYARWHKIDDNIERAESNYLHNKEAEIDFASFDSSGYIQNQKLADAFQYGEYTSDYNGCGWVATYNALRYLQIQGLYEDEIVIADIIRYYDHYGLFIDGTFGTLINVIENYFKEQGFEINTYLDSNKFDQVIKEADVCISWGLIPWKGHYQTVNYDGSGYKFYNSEFYYDSYLDYMEEIGTGIYYIITINAN